MNNFYKYNFGLGLILSFLTFAGCFGDDVLEEAVVESIGFTSNIKADAIDIAVDSTFAINFDAEIDPTSVTASNLYIVENKSDVIVSEIIDNQCLTNTPLTGSITCDEKNLTCTLTLEAALLPNTAYLLCMRDNIKLASAAAGTFVGNSIAFKTISIHTIGGTLNGLTGTIVLQNNAGDDIELTHDGDFTFVTSVNNKASYRVSIKTQPRGQTCSVGKGSGTLSGADISNVTVTCSTKTYSVGGPISGLRLGESVVLQNNAADDLSITLNGEFTFAIEVADGAHYAVTVLTQPTGQTCSLVGDTGTIRSGNVSNVEVTCTDKPVPSNDLPPVSDIPAFSVGGTVSSLLGTLVLQLDGSNNLVITQNGEFTFDVPSPATPYSVTILTQPISQTCLITNGTGTITNANINNVSIICHTKLVGFGTGLSGALYSTENFSSTDNDNFTQLSTGTTPAIANINVTDLFYSNSAVRQYYATGGGGLSISTDNGLTFDTINVASGAGLTTNNLNSVYGSADGSIIYVGSDSGLFISALGQDFTQIDAPTIAASNVNEVFCNADGTRVYVATSNGLSISTNSGVDFTNLTMVSTPALPNNVVNSVVASEDGTKIFVGTNNGLAVSVDSGATFPVVLTTISTPAIENNTINDVFITGNGTGIYVATGNGVSVSTDSGLTFNPKTPGLNSNVLSIAVSRDGTTIFVATAGGFAYSRDGGATYIVPNLPIGNEPLSSVRVP